MFSNVHTQLIKCDRCILHPLLLSAQETPLQRRPREVRFFFFFCRSSAVTVDVSRPADSVIVKSSHFAYSLLTDHPGPTHTHYRVTIIEAGPVDSSSCYVVLGCEVLGVGDSDDTGMRGLCMCPCGARVDPSFLPSLSSAPPPWRSSNIPVMFFFFFYKCPFSLPPSAPSTLRGVGGEVFQESSINVRAEEPRVRVSFHQPVNYLLSVIKAVHGGSLDVPFDLLSGVIVDVDLEWGRKIGMRGFEPRVFDVWPDTLPILYSCQSATCIFIFNMTWRNKEI